MKHATQSRGNTHRREWRRRPERGEGYSYVWHVRSKHKGTHNLIWLSCLSMKVTETIRITSTRLSLRYQSDISLKLDGELMFDRSHLYMINSLTCREIFEIHNNFIRTEHVCVDIYTCANNLSQQVLFDLSGKTGAYKYFK